MSQIEIQSRDAGRWMAAATCAKFVDTATYDESQRRWAAITDRLFRQAIDDGNKALAAGDADAVESSQKLVARYQPRIGGNYASSAVTRDLIEKYWDRLCGLDQKRGHVIDARVKLDLAGLRALAENEHDFLALQAVAISDEYALGSKNLLLNSGINELWELVTFDASTSAVRWNTTNAQIGVGTSTTAAVATQTTLQAAGVYVAMVSGFPTFGTLQLADWKGSFAAGIAAQSWQEWSCRNNATRLKLLNRKVEDLGVKSATAVWTLEITVTLS